MFNNNQEIVDFLEKSSLERPCVICHKLTRYYIEFNRSYICSPKCLKLFEDKIAEAEEGKL